MPSSDLNADRDRLAVLVEEVGKRSLALRGDDSSGYVSSELSSVNRVLARIQAEGLAQGPLFCEWGSGLGGVCGVATLNGFTAVGIEIQGELVDAARSLAADLGLAMAFSNGTFLLPGDEDLAGAATRTQLDFDRHAWDELEVAPADCDVVFAYPWPGEEALIDGVFARRAAPGALLVTYHGWDHVLLQRKIAGAEDLLPLGWM